MQPFPERNGRSVRVAAVLVALLALLAVVALASRTGFETGRDSRPTPGYVNWAMSIFMILFVLMIPVAAYAYSIQMREWRVQNKRSMQARMLRSLGVMLVVFGLAGVIVYVRGHSNLFAPLNGFLTRNGGAGTKAHGGGRTTYDPTFQWPVLWVALAAALIAGAWFLHARGRRAAITAAEEASVAEDVVTSIGDAIADLEAEADARRAVIAAYARMEGAFARHGLRRNVSETPGEYLRRLLLGLTSRVEAVRTLTSLFEQAKFSDHPIDNRMKQSAIDALRTIGDDLRAAQA